jgi:hypothetical protein
MTVVEPLGRHLGRFRGQAPRAHRDALRVALPLGALTGVLLLVRQDTERLWLVVPFLFAVYVLVRAKVLLGAWLSRIDLYEDGLVVTSSFGKQTTIRWNDVNYVEVRRATGRGLVITTTDPLRTVCIPWPLHDGEFFYGQVASRAGADHPLSAVLSRSEPAYEGD